MSIKYKNLNNTSNKKNLFKLFMEDTSYNYHLIKTEDPNGHLLYLIRNGSNIDVETLEFSPTAIVEELIDQCSVKIEKFAPAIFFTDEFDTNELKYKLNDQLSEDPDFSSFIETIKDEYRILEVKDSLLYKKDPEAYEAEKQKEHIEHQKELWDEVIAEHEEKKKKREEYLLEYENNLIKLLKEYFDSIIEFEKRDFNLNVELEKIVSNLIDVETWIKIEDKPFVCRIELCNLEQDRMDVFLTDNNDYSYTATLRFDKTVLVTENVIRINSNDELPKSKPDYDILAQLYDIDLSSILDWEYKNETERFEHVIDYLVPIFKAEIEKKKQEYVDKIEKEEKEEKEKKEEQEKEDNNNSNNNNNNMKIKKVKKSQNPNDWYFDVFVSDSNESYPEPSMIALSEDGNGLDDQLGSHNLPQPIIDALNRAGIFGDSEMMEAIWEVNDPETKTKEDIIKSMEKEGFEYSEGMLG